MQGQQFFKNLVNQEAARVRKSLGATLDETSPVELKSLAEQVIAEYSELSARLHVLELALEAGLVAPNPFEKGPLLVASFTRDAAYLASQSDLIDLEKDSELGCFCWTKSSSWLCTLPVLRLQARRLRIFFVAIIKPEYARSLKIFIDGVAVSHRVVKSRGSHCLELVLPPSDAIALSELELRLPDTHTPMELGQSDDARRLGIALSGLVVDDVPRALGIRRRIGLGD